MVRSCLICDELLNGENSYFFNNYLYREYTKANLRGRILFRDANFVVMPSAGPISDCHLLVLPVLHVNSFAELDAEDLCKAQSLIQLALAKIRNLFRYGIVFEHGSFGGLGSSSCNHAHMHIIACQAPLDAELKKEGLLLRKISTLSDIRMQAQRGCPYFYFQGADGYSWIMDDHICRSQYLRIMTANLIGQPERGIWQKQLGIKEMVDMNILLKNVFKEPY